MTHKLENLKRELCRRKLHKKLEEEHIVVVLVAPERGKEVLLN